VVDKFVAEVEGQLAEKKVRIELGREARDWLATRGYDPDFGARPMARLIQTELKDPIADQVLFGSLQKGGTVRVGVEGDALTLACEGRS
jgi:ATP-dependent Clp protease ATP-binding subunit ClpA